MMAVSFLALVVPLILIALVATVICITGALVTDNEPTLRKFFLAFIITQALVAMVPVGMVALILAVTYSDPNATGAARPLVILFGFLAVQGIGVLAFYFGYGKKRRRLTMEKQN